MMWQESQPIRIAQHYRNTSAGPPEDAFHPEMRASCQWRAQSGGPTLRLLACNCLQPRHPSSAWPTLRLEQTKTKKALFVTMVTCFGVKENDSFRQVLENQITMDALFEE